MNRGFWAVFVVGAAAAGLVCFWFTPSAVAGYFAERFLGRTARVANEISVWHPWGGTQKELFERAIRGFEKAHPGLKVRVVFTPNDLSNNQKFFTSVAAGKPPDVCFVDGPQVAEWAEEGGLQPLDGRLRRAGIRPDDYFAPCWKQNYYEGHVWALTYYAGPNFGFAWNKDVFRRAGLDPDRPPSNIAELDRIADKLTIREPGGLKTIGIVPWGQFGPANSMYTWGWAFGGDFYDEETRKVTANHPGNVAALEWMCSYARKYGVTRIASLQQGFGNLDKNPFYTGQLGMCCYQFFQIEDAKMYAPKLDYGIGYIPSPPGGEPRSSWIGGWCMALPKGSRQPELGWELIRWLCADPEGTCVAAQAQQLFPGYRKSPCFATAVRDSRCAQFLEILEQCKHQRPVMPAQAYYMGALARAVDLAIHGRKTPKQALDDATRETQRELDLKLAGTR